VLDYRRAVILAGSLVTLGCGRLGFSDPDGGSPGDDDQPCTSSAFPISEGSTRALLPNMVWNGTKLGVSWLEDPEPRPAHFRTISLDGAADPIANLGIAGEPVEVAWDSASWRLAWSTADAKSEIMISTNGATARALTANQRVDAAPRIASLPGGKTAYLWWTDASTGNLRLTVLDAAGNKLVDDLGIGTGSLVNLVWTGSELVAFYTTSSSVMMLRLTPGGSPIGSATTAMTVSDLGGVLVGWAGDRFLVVYTAGSFGRSLYLTYVSRDGIQMFPSVFIDSPENAFFSPVPSIAVGPTSDALVWDKGTDISYLVEVFRDGTLGKPYAFEDTSAPAVAWVDTAWVVAVAQIQHPTTGMPDPKPDYIKLIRFCR
jgi:hypothetical protein